jgi:uncharacterized protein (DUF362 family)
MLSPEATQSMDASNRMDVTPPTSSRIFTRRRVLVGMGAAAGTVALGAGGIFTYDRYRRFARAADATIADHRVELPPTTPAMVIARGMDPATSVRAAVERLGGMSQFVNPSDVVVVKPNIGWDRKAEQGANTHPEVVAEVVRLCREAKARRVIVCDCPVKNARGAFERSGILAAANAAGAEVILPEASRHRTVQVSQRLGTWDVLEPFILATKVINVPVAKHHPLTGVTCGLKNWFGITTVGRMLLHQDVQRAIADLAALMRPTLTIVDASRVLMENGPAGGNVNDVKPVRTIAAGTDPVALDAWAVQLFPPQPAPASLGFAAAMGLGRVDYAALSPVEILAG